MVSSKQVSDCRSAGLSPAGGLCSASVSPEQPSAKGSYSGRGLSRSHLHEANGLDTAPRQGSRTCSALREEAGGSFIPHDQLTFVRHCLCLTPCHGGSLVTVPSVADLGEGTFAWVEQAELRLPGGRPPRAVAVKRLRTALIEGDQELLDFVREGALLKRLRHPCIVESVGLGFDPETCNSGHVDADCMYIVQEFMTHGSLKLKILEQMISPDEVVYSAEEALAWCLQIAEGLAYLHARRPAIVHRDLKLENCLLTDDGRGGLIAKVADFGLHAIVQATDADDTVKKLRRIATSPKEPTISKALLKRLDSQPTLQQHRLRPALARHSAPGLSRMSSRAKSMVRRASSKRPPPRYAMTGQTGSWLYMAPEVMLNKPYNEKVDIFSLGIVLYEVFTRSVTGVVLLSSNDEAECEMFAWKVAHGYRRPIPVWWPPELSLLVVQCWDACPEQRPSAHKVLERLRGLQASGAWRQIDRMAQPGGCCCSVQ